MTSTGRQVASIDHQLTRERYGQAVDALKSEQYALTLFVSGAAEASANAIANVREICDTHLAGRHELKIVDLHQEPERARQHHILATPTLVVNHPPPLRMLVGDMSDHPRILAALQLAPAGRADAEPLAPGVAREG